MKNNELINKLKNETKNIDFTIAYENENIIRIDYLQKYFSIYGYVIFDKESLNLYKDTCIHSIVMDIVGTLAKKCFLGDKE